MHSALFETCQSTSRIGYASGPKVHNTDEVFQSLATVPNVSLCLGNNNGNGNSVFLAFAAPALIPKNSPSNAEIMIRHPVGSMPHGNTIGYVEPITSFET